MAIYAISPKVGGNFPGSGIPPESNGVFFANETTLDIPFTDGRYPTADVYVYDTNIPLPALNIEIDDSENEFTGTYQNIGVCCVDQNDNWTVSSDHKLFKLESENVYLGFHQGVNSWIIFESENDHNNIGQTAETQFFSLDNFGTLPESFSRFSINQNLNELDTTQLFRASPRFILDKIGKKLILDFGDISQSGVLIYK